MDITKLLEFLHAAADAVLFLGGVLHQLVQVKAEMVRLGQHVGEQAAGLKAEACVLQRFVYDPGKWWRVLACLLYSMCCHVTPLHIRFIR